LPSYRRHKATAQAVVTLDGRDIYLGKHNSAASRAEYNRLIAEWSANHGALPKPAHDLVVNELLAAFIRHAKYYYRGPDGQPEKEYERYQYVLRWVKQLYGRTPADRFGPLALKAVRQQLIDHGLTRRSINRENQSGSARFQMGCRK